MSRWKFVNIVLLMVISLGVGMMFENSKNVGFWIFAVSGAIWVVSSALESRRH